MARKPTLEPRWLVGLLNQWAIRSVGRSGYPKQCAWLRVGPQDQARPYEPQGYGQQDFKDLEAAMKELDSLRVAAIGRYFKPWMRDAIHEAHGMRDNDTWMYHLKIALEAIEVKMRRIGRHDQTEVTA